MNLAQIAELANVSTATVSRTINRVPTVDPVLARRVWRVIEQVGYYPNTQARALVSGRSRILGLLVSDISNPFFPEIVQTFTKLGIEHDYEVLAISIDQDSTRLENIARRMIQRRVDGVAILTFQPDESLISIFRNRNLPVFTIEADSHGQLLTTVHIDYRHGIRQAVQHLAALGHERIAFVSGPRNLRTAAMREGAFQECMNEISLNTPRELFLEGDHTMEGGMRAMSALAGASNRPTAVICSNDLTAIGVMRRAFELSLNVPKDLSVIGFDDIRLAEFMIPPLTSVQMSQAEIAETAFRALLEGVSGESAGLSREPRIIKTNLVIRGSTTLAPARLKESRAKADQSLALEPTCEQSQSPIILN